MDIQLPQIIFQIVNFSVVLGALSYFLYKPIQKILDERARRVEEGQQAAQKSLTEIQQFEETKKTIKQKAEKEAVKLLEEAVTAAKERKAQLVIQAKQEATVEVERLRQAWNEEKRTSLQSMKQEFSEAVIATAEKVVGKTLDAKSHTKLIDDELSSLLKSI